MPTERWGGYGKGPAATYLTNPVHGGKVTCRVCGGFIDETQKYIKRGESFEHMPSDECNRYLNYYGPGRPID